MITLEESEGMTQVTKWSNSYAFDEAMYPKKIRILHGGVDMVVQCNIRKKQRAYNHLGWIMKECDRINASDNMVAEIVCDNDKYILVTKEV